MASGILLCILWSFCRVKSHSNLHLSFSSPISGLYSYHFSFTYIPHFLHISQWIFAPNQSCCLLYSFWANSLHTLNTWFTLSSAFPHIRQLQLSVVLSIFACVLLVLVAYSCVAIIKASVVLLKHILLNHLHPSSVTLTIVCLINCPCNWFCAHCVLLFILICCFYISIFLYCTCSN